MGSKNCKLAAGPGRTRCPVPGCTTMRVVVGPAEEPQQMPRTEDWTLKAAKSTCEAAQHGCNTAHAGLSICQHNMPS